MAKKGALVFVLAVIIAGVPVFAQERGIDFHLNFTNLGFGVYLPSQGVHIFETSLDLLTFGIEDRKTGVGVLFDPFSLYWWLGKSGGNIPVASELAFSFINPCVYWNITGALGVEGFFFGPSIGLNWLFMTIDTSEMNTNKYILSIGLQGGIRGGNQGIHYNVFSVETGFRLIDGDPKFFVGLKFDYLMKKLRF